MEKNTGSAPQGNMEGGRRMAMVRWGGFLVLLAGMSSSSWGDTVVFKNGERLIGTLVRLKGGKLVFKSEVAGEVTVDIAQVKTFVTDEPVEMHFQDGTVLKSKANEGAEGRFGIEGTELVGAQEFNLRDLQAINPSPPPPVKWTGDVSAGFSSTNGNTFSESGNVGFNVVRRSEKRRFRAGGLYLISREENSDKGLPGEKDKRTSEESVFLAGKYDYFFTQKFFGFLNSSFKKDHIADLDRRIIIGAGGGYQWVETDQVKFSSDVGLAFLNEKYTTPEEETTNDELSAQAGYNLDWVITEKYTFMHNLRYFPSFGGISDYYLTTNAELRASIKDNMFGSLKTIFDYDSTPAETSGSTDTKYILSLVWTF